MEPEDPPRRHPSLMRMLEQAREQRGSPPLWDAVAARLDEENRRRDLVAPMLHLLDQIRERVDDETWKLLLELEWRSSREVVAGIEVGLELGYDHGRAAALMEAQRVPGQAASALEERFADLLGDTNAEHPEVLLALVATLHTAVRMGGGTKLASSTAATAGPPT